MLAKYRVFMNGFLFLFYCFSLFKNSHLDISTNSVILHLFETSEYSETFWLVTCYGTWMYARQWSQMGTT